MLEAAFRGSSPVVSVVVPTIGRLASKVRMAAWLEVLPPSRARARRASSFSSPPSRQADGMRTSSKMTSAVWLARMPIFFSFLPMLRPGVPGEIGRAHV